MEKNQNPRHMRKLGQHQKKEQPSSSSQLHPFCATITLVADQHLPRELKKESEVAQSCLTLCNPVDCSPPGSFVYRILKARILEWVAISFSGDLPNTGMEPRSPALQADSLPSEL